MLFGHGESVGVFWHLYILRHFEISMDLKFVLTSLLGRCWRSRTSEPQPVIFQGLQRWLMKLLLWRSEWCLLCLCLFKWSSSLWNIAYWRVFEVNIGCWISNLRSNSNFNFTTADLILICNQSTHPTTKINAITEIFAAFLLVYMISNH